MTSTVLSTCYSCEGHFRLDYSDAFCHHNQKAQVHFVPRDLLQVARLTDEILRSVDVEGIEIEVRQSVVRSPDDIEVQWEISYRPLGYWEIVPQDDGVYVSRSANWTEEKARKLLRKAFDQTIGVCRRHKVDTSG